MVSDTTCAAAENVSSSGGAPARPNATLSGYGLVHDGTSAVPGLGEVGDGGQRLVVDVDQLDGVLGDVPALGDDERDRVADELHLALGQRRAGRVRHVLAHDRVPGLLDVGVEVGGREHRVHAGQRQRRRGVDAVDRRAGERAAHEAGVQHAGPRDVVDEGAVAGEQPGVLDARDPGARVAGRDGLHGVTHANHSLMRLKSDVIASESDISTQLSHASRWMRPAVSVSGLPRPPSGAR